MNIKLKLFIWVIAITVFFTYSCKKFNNSDKVVNFYGWYGAIPQEVFDDFEKETGIRVLVDTFDDNETAEAKLLTGNSGYDIVVISLIPYTGRQCM
ncbi:MAG: hypothetical protein LBF70_02675, partial [Holosporales bacterium]|nr:hypothetical protein [Holosporales bacterium]